jgi:hypothetical protein
MFRFPVIVTPDYYGIAFALELLRIFVGVGLSELGPEFGGDG